MTTQFAASIPVLVRKRYPMDVSCSHPVPDVHQSYSTVSGEPFPLTVSNDPAVHSNVCSFKYQSLGGSVTVDEKVVEPLALSISGRWDRSYKFDAGKIWAPYLKEYKPIKTSLDTYVTNCLGLEACPTEEYQFIFGENRNPIHPVLSAAYDRRDEKGKRIYEGFPMGGTMLYDNPQLAFEYAWIVLLQLWLHVNNRWLEQRVPTSAGPLHVFILHPQDFEESKIRGDLSKYIALSGEKLARSAGELSASAFICAVTSKLMWHGKHSLFDSADPSDRTRSTLLFQMRAKGFVPLRYGEAVKTYYDAAVEIARDQMVQLKGHKELAYMKAEAEKAGVVTHRAGSLKEKESITMTNIRAAPGTTCPLNIKQLDIAGDTISKPPFCFTHLYFTPTDSVFKYLIRPTMRDYEGDDRYECIAWQLPRFLNHTALTRFDSAMMKLRKPPRRTFFTRAAEPEWLCSRSALMRYACFIHEQSVYLVHPYQLGTGKMTALDPFIQRAVDRRMSEFKHTETGALVANKKRKAEETGASLEEIQKSKVVDAYSAVEQKLPADSRRPSVVSPVSVDIPRLMHMWSQSPSHLPRAQCVKIMESYRGRYCLFYRMISLYEDHAMNESTLWWVLFHAEAVPDHSPWSIEHVQAFFAAKSIEWDQSTRTLLRTQAQYALSRCREWERMTLYGFLERLKDAFHMTEPCEDDKSHNMRRINDEFDRMMFVPQMVRTSIQTAGWKITVTDHTPDQVNVFIDQLCAYFTTAVPPTGSILTAHYTSESLPPSERVVRTLAEEIIHTWMYNVKRPIFYYLLFAVSPSFGHLLGDGSTEWKATLPKSAQDTLDRYTQQAAFSTALIPSSASAVAAASGPIVPRPPTGTVIHPRPQSGDAKAFAKPSSYGLLGLEHKIGGRYIAEIRGKNAKSFVKLSQVTKAHLEDEGHASFYVGIYGAIAQYCRMFKDDPVQRAVDFEEFLTKKKPLYHEALRRLSSDAAPVSPTESAAAASVDTKTMLLPAEYAVGSTYGAASASSAAAAAAPTSASVGDYKFPVSVQSRITDILKMEYEVRQCLTFPGIDEVAKEMKPCLPHSHLVHVPKYIARQIRNYNLQFANGYGVTEMFITRFATPKLGEIKYTLAYPLSADVQLYYKIAYELLVINCPDEFEVAYVTAPQNLLTAPPTPDMRAIAGPVSAAAAASVSATSLVHAPKRTSSTASLDFMNDTEYSKLMGQSALSSSSAMAALTNSLGGGGSSFSEPGIESMTPLRFDSLQSMLPPSTPGLETPQKRGRSAAVAAASSSSS